MRPYVKFLRPLVDDAVAFFIISFTQLNYTIQTFQPFKLFSKWCFEVKEGEEKLRMITE